MRAALWLALLSALVPSMPGQRKDLPPPNNDQVQTVRAALAEVSKGLYTSWTEKELARLGDASSVSLTKLFAGKELTPSDVDHALVIIGLSFASPELIQDSSDRQPRTTMFLLKSFEALPLDTTMKQRIAKTREMLLPMLSSAAKKDNASLTRGAAQQD